MNRILRIAFIILFLLSAILTVLYYAGGKDVSGNPTYTDIFIIWSYVLTALAIGLTVVFPIVHMITNPQKAKKSLLGILGLVVVLVITYFISSVEPLGIKNPELIEYDTPVTLKYAGTLINSIYILAAMAIISMLYSEVVKIFK